jgi:putative DNA primase/helicase
MSAAQIHTQLAGRWRDVLMGVGIDEAFLKKKPGPCPACGGRDRFTFTDRQQRGDFFGRGCGAGDGFTLVMKVARCDFGTAVRRVLEASGIAQATTHAPVRGAPIRPPVTAPASPTRRVRDLLRTSCAVEDCGDVMEYLASRALLPLPPKHGLSAHPSVEYFEGRERIGRFPALLAPMRDVAGALVTAHITYIERDRKLATHEPRKLLSPLIGRTGCAVRLQPVDGEALGVAEGIETAICAWALHGLPTWAALNTSLLAKFEAPPGVKRMVIFADRDIAGLEAAAHLMERQQGKLTIELRTPPAPAKDWADVLEAYNGKTA